MCKVKSRKRKNLTTQWSNIYIGISIIFVFGFGLFLTSKLYLADSLELNQTPLNQEFDLRSNGKFTIKEWVYDEPSNKMQITLVTNGIKNYNSELDFISVARSHLNKQLPTEVKYSANDIYIIQIQDVPKDFEQIAVRLFKSEVNFDEIFDKEQMDKTKKGNVISSIYTDHRIVKRAEVVEQDLNKYAIEMTEEILAETEDEMENLTRSIEKIEHVNARIMNEIDKLREELLYQTVEEQVETSNEIFTLEKEIEGYELERKTIESDIKNLEVKTKKLTQRKRDLEI